MSEPREIRVEPREIGWRAALRESNAIGWGILGVAIVAVLIGALTLGQAPVQEAENSPSPANTSVR